MIDHTAFAQKYIDEGFTRVERDDRLLDIYPRETREKGVEMWQKWDGQIVYIIRIRLPFNKKTVTRHELLRAQLEQDLLENTVRERLEQ